MVPSLAPPSGWCPTSDGNACNRQAGDERAGVCPKPA
eukprot:CAMPEP_0204581774 /NCGR_PEP_ID=MMETSP0661-20131031/44842_1 /ASSEMBLY_ACC=CAM_ASM_000606 /TAXON_ID=109239 /ORGANISM="Alexandrium margalefi, Strain AMGDE01CS-322" /LENGTH=36 /DNA_ID= /DNA_START= /DNA_END= /DNA_ORIENTATION=